MTMRGIDVSSWNGNPFNPKTELAYGQSDFLIAKTTQGTGYANPHAGYAIGRAIADGKLWGFYHYAGGGDPEAEADWFVEMSKGYFGRGVPVLDWEGEQNAAWGSTSWCRAFVERVHERTGAWCMLYTGLDGCRQAASCADVCALWFAGYPVNADSWAVPAFMYSVPHPWKGWDVWQFTSGGGVDRNITELSPADWARIALGDREDGKKEELKMTLKEIQQAILGYKNAWRNFDGEVVESGKDINQLVHEAANSWQYRNPALEEADAYQILRDARTAAVESGRKLDDIAKRLEEIAAKL